MRRSPEFDLISRARELFRATTEDCGRVLLGAGDDAALTLPGAATATSVDAIVEGVHFRSSWCPPRAVGRKAIAAALSDLAAMGAEPGEAYVWLGAPQELSDEDCLELCAGIAEVAVEHEVAVVGGDLTAAPVLAVSITVVGHGDRDGFVRRDGAPAAEVVCVSGALGGAAAALVALESAGLEIDLGEERYRALINHQLAPTPRLAAGRLLAAAGVSAMIDVSDGLGVDAEQLAAASGVGIEIDLARVPLSDGVAEIATASGRDRIEFAAAGGDDLELLCVMPPGAVAAASAALEELGLPLSEIGSTLAGQGVKLRQAGGRPLPIRGHDHRSR